MTKNRNIIIIVITAVFFLYYTASAQYTSFKIHGMSSAVNIDDILNRSSKGFTGADIKRICAEITERYHKKGYTAFYISSAVLNKDGTVELFFNESVVVEISLTGVIAGSEEISSSIYKKGDIFNEFILKENITLTRKKYKLKYINVSIKRTADDHIHLQVKAVERSDEIHLGMSSSPIYGMMPELAYALNSGMFHAGISLCSSFSQKVTSYGKFSAFMKKDVNPNNYSFIILSDYSTREDFLYNNTNLIYEHNSITTKTGICLYYGALQLDFFLAGTYDILENYPGIDGGTSFAGLEFRFSYNDSPFKIDLDDMTSCGIDFFSGWNFIEDAPVSRTAGEYKINVPLFTGFFLSFNGNFFCTSDGERFLQDYVFDQKMPCRNNDYTFSTWKNITGIDLMFEIMKRTVYAAPGYKWGLHNSPENLSSVHAGGVKGFFIAEKIKVELSYFYDVDNSLKDGYFFISAAGYL